MMEEEITVRKEKDEMTTIEQIAWYLERLNEKQLNAVLLYAYRLFLGMTN